MQRVLVMGSSGSGKSTFARRLSEIAGIPFVSLDALYWKPGWVAPDNAEFEQRVAEIARQPRWVMDGNYTRYGAGELRRQTSDTVIWFDLPRRSCMLGIMRRVAGSYGKVRPEMAEGCP
jgi:adenylate kinase family enzyme